MNIEMIRAFVLFGLGVALFFGAFTWGCYATTGPTPSCAADPTQDWCVHPVHDHTADGGR